MSLIVLQCDAWCNKAIIIHTSTKRLHPRHKTSALFREAYAGRSTTATIYAYLHANFCAADLTLRRERQMNVHRRRGYRRKQEEGLILA